MKKLLIAVAIILSLSLPGAALAQTSNGTIAGTVVDSSGASVVKATVTILGAHTGATRSTVTNGAGGYRFDSVLLDTYTVSAEAQGFAKKSVTDVLVTGSIVTSVNPVLSPGNVNDTIEVRAASELIQTDSGELSATLGTHALSNLPVSSTNPYQLAITLPGVSQPPSEFQNSAGFPNGFNFAVNGSRPRSNNFLIEGQDNNDQGLHGQGLQPENFEAYQDLTVLLNSYGAEFGHGAGSVSNLLLKSGTNSFHGSVYERIENSSLNAIDKGDLLNGSTTQSKYRENLAGFSFGGPVLHNRAFFFVSYQLDHYRASANVDPILIPTVNGLAKLQAFESASGNPRVAAYLQALNGIAAPEGQPFTASYALTEIDPTTNQPYSIEVGPYRRNIGAASNASELDIKGDYIISPKDTLQLHYIRSPYSTPLDTSSAMLPGFDTDQEGVSHNAGLAETHTFSPHLLNEFRFSYGRIGFSFNLAPSTLANSLSKTPEINIGTASGIYPGSTGDATTFGSRPDFPQGRFHNTYQIQDTVTWNKGRHTIRAGADLPIIQVRDPLPFNTYGSLSYANTGKTISALANFVDDFGGDNGSIAKSFGDPDARPIFYFQHYFVQDSWKAAQNLTIELGFRYELSGTPFNSVKYVGVTPASASNYLAAVPQKADNSDWGPRFGFAWTPYSDKKTVLRGGFGVFYDGLFTNIIDNIQGSSPNATAPDQISSAAAGPRGTPNLSTGFPSLNTTPGPLDNANYIDPNIVSPRTLQWNLNLEQELPGSFTWQVGYVGTRGEHLYATTEFNPYIDQGDPVLNYESPTRLFPTRNRIVREDNTGDSIYHALQTQVVRKYRNGLQVRAAYTWSHMEDDASEIFTTGQFSTYGVRQYPNPRKFYDWSDSAYDHRHRLALSYFYEIPKIPNTPHVVDSLVNGWSLAGITEFQTGNPANVEIGDDWNGDGILNDRPILGNPHAPLASYAIMGDDPIQGFGLPAGTLCDGPTWFWSTNPCKVVQESQVHWILPHFATSDGPLVKRNVVRLRGYQNWDVSAQKSFRTWHEQSLDFRAEMFNIANHGNTGTPNLNIFTGFGDPTTNPPSANSFGDYAPTVTGHRAVHFFARYRF